MEVIHLILGKANPDRMNGVNKVVYQLATQQAASGRKVAVWGITKELTHNYGERNFETQLFQAFTNPFKLDSKLKEAIIAKKGKAVFHLHGGWVPTYSSVSKFLSKHEIPYVLTAHGAYNTIAMKRNSLVKKIYFKAFENNLLVNAKRIHAIGESEIQGLNQIYPNTKSFHLPYGFEASQAVTSEATKSKDFIIGFVGRLDIYTKGLDILLKAFDKFQKVKPNTKLWIIGDSQERSKLEEMISRVKLNDKVVLFGGKFGEEKNTLISNMTIFTHPSRNEGLPVSVLEACNMQIPAVVTQATNIATHITQFKSGIAIPNEDAEALTKAFLELYFLWENNQLNTLKVNARKMVIDAFNWNHITTEFDKLYV